MQADVYCLAHGVLLANKELPKSLNHANGVISFSNPDKIDFDIIKKLLTDTVNSEKKPANRSLPIVKMIGKFIRDKMPRQMQVPITRIINY
jgi:hypothetical protein